MIFSISTYTYVSISSLFWDELKNSWDTNGNVTCFWNPPGVKMGLYPATAMAQFQILRIVRIQVKSYQKFKTSFRMFRIIAHLITYKTMCVIINSRIVL